MGRLLSKWQLQDLELRVESTPPLTDWSEDAAPKPPRPPLPLPPPPFTVTQHVKRLHLRELTLPLDDLAAWQLHDPARWPRLQHLTVSKCTLPPAATTPHPPLQPIPGLQSFTWDGVDSGALLALAANATQAHVLYSGPAARPLRAGALPHLTHLRLDDAASAGLRALLEHPTLAHVTIGWLALADDHSRQPCRWRTLTLAWGANLGDVARLPLAGLERLTIAHGLGAGTGTHQQCAGVAALRRLHGEGRLAVLPSDDEDLAEHYGLPLSAGMFHVLDGPADWTAAVLRLALEAGRGVRTLAIGFPRTLPLPVLREQVAPLLRRRGAHVGTLCVDLGYSATEEWCAGLLGALPPTIARAQACTDWPDPCDRRKITALVRGGAAGPLRHALRVTYMGGCNVELETELRGLAAGSGAGAGEGGGGTAEQRQRGAPLLTVEVAPWGG